MSLRRTFDATFLNQVVNDPRVRPWLGGDRKSRLDLQPAIDAGAIALINRDGGFLFVPKGDGVFEVHTQFLPSVKGKAVRFAREAARYMFKQVGAEKLVTDVPEDNQAALADALGAGWEIASVTRGQPRVFHMELTKAGFFRFSRKWASAQRFAKATDTHARRVARHIRQSDKQELEALGINDPEARLKWAIRQTGDARAIIDADGVAVAIFGVCELDRGAAAPWMICADDVASAKRLIARHGKRWVRAWRKRWPLLRNCSDGRNLMHHRFIEWCGFTWAGETRIGGVSFRIFEHV